MTIQVRRIKKVDAHDPKFNITLYKSEEISMDSTAIIKAYPNSNYWPGIGHRPFAKIYRMPKTR